MQQNRVNQPLKKMLVEMANGVKKMALDDITAENSAKITVVKGRKREVWSVTAFELDSEETRVLNQQLGLHKINKQQNNLNFGKNKTNDHKK